MTTVNIGTVEELQDFASRVNAGETTLDAVLTADINLTGITWTPIGTSTYPYAGTFDGNGHVISNMMLTGSGSHTGFILVASGVTVKNLGFENCTVTVTTTHFASIIICRLEGNGNTIENCYTKDCSLTSYGYSGHFMTNGNGKSITIRNSYVLGGSVSTSTTRVIGISPFIGQSDSYANVYVYNSYAYLDAINLPSSPSLEGSCSGIGGIVSGFKWDMGGNYNYVYNSVSLTPIITNINSVTYVGRISGNQLSVGSNNYGYNPTTVGTTSITSGSQTNKNGANIDSTQKNSETWWKTTSGLEWDWTNIWYWDSAVNLPKLQVFKPSPSINISDGTTWSNGTPYVYDTEWLQGEKIHVYISSGWTEKV